MAKNRYLPFGYRLADGKIVMFEPEADCIRQAYEAYADGSSFAAIAELLQATGVRYHAATPFWNKNMVKRILENERYTGAKEYPPIITLELFERVERLRKSKAVQRSPKPKAAPVLPASMPQTVAPPLPDITITRLENQINHELSKPVLEPGRLRGMILQCATLKYEALCKAQRKPNSNHVDADSVHFDINTVRRISDETMHTEKESSHIRQNGAPGC